MGAGIWRPKKEDDINVVYIQDTEDIGKVENTNVGDVESHIGLPT